MKPLLAASLLAIASIASADKVDDLIRREMEHFKIPGAQVAIVQNGKILKVKEYGMASLEFNQPMRRDTPLQIASATKVFTGVATMMLVERGEFSLDDPVSKYVPDAPSTWAPLKLWHLLSFTSGLQDKLTFEKPIDADVMRSIKESPMAFAPGEKWQYSQAGKTLWDLILRARYRKTHAQLAQEMIFQPLGMKSSAYGGTSTFIPKRHPVAYVYTDGRLETSVWPFDTGYGFTGTGLNTTAADAALFLQALQTGKLLKPESMKRMWTSVTLNDGKPAEYGIGWDMNKVDEFLEVGHEGGGCSWIRYYPAADLGVVFLTNLKASKADRIHRDIARLYLKRS